MKSKNRSNILLLIIFIIGLSLILYPIISNSYNTRHASKLISEYSEAVKGTDGAIRQKLFDEALAYNKALSKKFVAHNLNDEEAKRYKSVLDITGTGIMGYIEIPSIDVTLPIYHGMDEGALQIAASHIEWSSLPVGGATTHCVISGHRGLPSAKLFTDLDKLSEGDYFGIRVLDESLWYEVDKITIVEPSDVNGLYPEKGMDYVTLVTCTPYGINTHRLLVRGHRVTDANLEKVLKITADAVTVNPLLIAVILYIPFAAVALTVPLIIGNRKRKQKSKSTLRRKK